MRPDFEELDYRRTRLGELVLRRRRLLSLEGTEVYEVKLGDEFLIAGSIPLGLITGSASGAVTKLEQRPGRCGALAATPRTG